MDKFKVSIIMPVYNAEKYLYRSIDSVKKQTYQAWELLIVDDGSTDTSIEICRMEERKDSRIKLICNKHGGTARARNLGINKATGDYLAFLDADDLFHPLFLENMMSIMQKENVDMTIGEIVRGNNPEDFLKKDIAAQYEYITVEDAFRKMYQGEWPKMIAPVNKIYSRQLFEETKFPDGRYFEDAATTNLAIYRSKKIAVTKEMFYFYNITPNSSSVTKRSCELLDREWALRSHWEFFLDEDRKDLVYLAIPFYLVELISIYHRIEKSDQPSDVEIIRKRFNDTYKKFNHKIKLSEEQKNQILAFRYPRIYDIRNMIREDGVIKTGISFVRRKLKK